MTVDRNDDRPALPLEAPEPRALPPAAPVLVAAGIALIAAAVIAARELLIHHGILTASPWLADAFRWIAQLTWRTWMYYAAPAAIVVGLILVWSAARPRRRTHARLDGEPALWFSPTAVARTCSARAQQVDAVASAQSAAGRRRVRVTVTVPERAWEPPPDDAAISARVRAAVEPFTAALTPSPRVAVRIIRVPPTRQNTGDGRVR